MSQYSRFFALVNQLGWEESDWRNLVEENTNGRTSSLKACNEAEFAQILAHIETLAAEPKPKQSVRLTSKIYALCYELNFTKAGKEKQIIIDNERLDKFLELRTEAKKPLSKQNNSELQGSIKSLDAYLKHIIKNQK